MPRSTLAPNWACCLAAALLLCTSGCLLSTPHHGIPVKDLDLPLAAPPKSAMVPLNLAMLKQDKPPVHILGAGDVLNIYVHGVLPPNGTPPQVQQGAANVVQGSYYPVNGALRGPSFGVPMEITRNGLLRMPLLGELKVDGMPIDQFENLLRQRYVEQGIIEPQRDRIFVSLLKSRVQRVVVVREDSAQDMPVMISRQSIPLTKRGRAQVVDLPAFENDVLHALTATGGLPGIDAKDEVWVLRGGNAHMFTAPGHSPVPMAEPQAIKIPLRIVPGQPLPFDPSAIVLQDGDVVVVPKREEYYYSAGLLPAGKIPIPKDDDLDVVEAISMSGGSVGSPGGVAGGGAMFRTGGLGGIIPPSMVAIVRTLPSKEQVLIKVDLAKAMKNPNERIMIQPGDVIYLHYTRTELAGNMLLSLFNFNFLIDTGLKL